MKEKECKNCKEIFTQYKTTQNICGDCEYKRSVEKSSRVIRKRINHRGKKTHQWLDEDRPKWIKNHPPSHEGYWQCYLMIHPRCPIFINEGRLTLDHVKPRGTHPHKRRSQQNLKPACRYCNGLKGSMSLPYCLRLYKKTIDKKKALLAREQIL